MSGICTHARWRLVGWVLWALGMSAMVACDGAVDPPDAPDEAVPTADAPGVASVDPPGADDHSRPTADELADLGDFTTGEITLDGPDGEQVGIAVYAAVTDAQRRQGLMFVDDLPDDAGMVFRFPDDRDGGFYMFNTLLPLSIGFFAADGELLAILDMDPCESTSASECEIYRPGVTYRSALEVHQGWFDRVGVEPGWRLGDDHDLPAPS